ncbi:transcriptional regulator [Herbiconiux sp. CPCC 203407]|uniref:Transcriptional regulator n=1 Tax=Herbiconiux oxytropis TaxID=2970915 RepID=A0AA41XJM2_9MICO|nr:transcriptional regulator [Herbiconiux oxytropis]MCS5723389.1 transcriptional regulator [Herbiconiux oxytropis]MCS5727964.1 transcriptional regulator [Herbiconiux oxytropis]
MVADDGFDEQIHAPTRLRICGLLRPVDGAEFSALRSTLGLSEANLSKTLRSLTEIGYVRVSKASSTSRGDQRRTTTVALTAEGRRAFDGHVAALRRIAGEA